ncbi:MAG: helix-turn-helix domain-containing protein, partial [Peptococcaceae bacterium]|nr:helix-turn-helix domain-containing protein [Peptococcaceae bacterium]
SKQVGKLFADSLERGTHMLLVGGDTGIGKSCLLQQLRGNVETRGGFYLVCKSGPLGSSYPYHPLAELLRILLEQLGQHKVKEVLASYSPRVINELALLVPKYGSICNLMARSYSYTENLPEKLFLENACSIVSDLLQQVAVVLIIEDIPYADPTTLEVIQYFIEHQSAFHMLICGTYDLDDVDLANAKFTSFRNFIRTLNSEDAIVRINLLPFNREETEEFIQSLLEQSVLPAGLADAIFQKSEGNPLVIRHLVGKLITTGNLKQAGRGWQYSRPREIALPEEIKEMFLLRLQGIRAEVRAILSTAAVLGRRFTAQNLAQVLDISLLELLPLLEEAIGLKLIEEHYESAQGYFTFVSSRLQEVLYESISYQRKVILHEQIGVLLEQTVDPRQNPDELAYHFQWGADRSKAVKYAIVAGQRAISLYAFQTAWRYFVSARDIFPLLDQLAAQLYRYAVLEGLAESACFLGYYQEAWRYLGELLNIGVEKGTARYASVQNKLGDLSFRMGNYKETLEHYSMALESSRDVHKQAILNNIIFAYIAMDKIDEAESLAELLAQRAKNDNDAGVAQEVSAIYTFLYIQSGEINKALEHATKLAAYPNSNALAKLLSYFIRGQLALEHGELAEADSLFNMSLDIAKKMQDPLLLGQIQTRMAQLAMLRGDYSMAQTILERVKSLEVYTQAKLLRLNVYRLESYLALLANHQTKLKDILVDLQEVGRNREDNTISQEILTLEILIAASDRTEQALTRSWQYLEDLAQTHLTPRNRLHLLRVMALCQQWQGDMAAVRELVAQMSELCLAHAMYAEGFMLCTLWTAICNPQHERRFRSQLGLPETVIGHPVQGAVLASDSSLPPELADVLEHVHNQFAGDVNVATLCHIANMSERQLRRLFSHYFGLGIKEYVTAFRIEKAKELLQNPTLSISQVGSLVGLSDKSQFCKTFKALMGVSPSEFRKLPRSQVRNSQQIG